ncbi:uncharacterized protein LOC122014406 isoform X1 [Zingiber officinale]|uniref:Protein kinase domain-containing protein n=1 Tax=Zingiber officinale TaxID=94328 RepID=A0A8J5KC75_ZINOF|nr:uncharacterized protein LOC122014406 isoform X1 [Zingiber officinale]KAG6481351.1 hypothetical protein ZIOFF_057950 [Zingiber officinale]
MPEMELSAAAAGDSSRVKLLCSFGGTILPRPLDGRLRYVGGETRIVTFPRRFSYKILLTRARELFDGTSIIKYQQPDEEIDALVSVVNDEDVVNMMEEYDRLSAVGNGGAWLRIFLFPPALDHDLPFAAADFNADERENERRYFDALNCLADASVSPPNISENYLGANFNLQNLHRLTIPHHSHSQMYDEVDASCRSAFFSPGRHAANDAIEFLSSPSSAIYQPEAGEFGVKFMDDYVRQTPGYICQSPPSVENLAWIPTGTAVQEISGFPTNLEHFNTMTEGNNICDHRLMAFHRSQSTVSGTYLKHGLPHLDHPNMTDECVGIFQNSSAECFSGRNLSMVNQDMKIQHGTYANMQKEQHNPLGAGHEWDWAAHNHQSPYYDMRMHHDQTVRVNEHYIVDGTVVNCQFVRGNTNGGHLLHSNCIRHDDTQYLQHGAKFGNDIFLPQQTVGGCNGAQAMRFEAAEAQYPNQCSPHGAESVYQSPNIFHPNQYPWRSRQATTHPGTFYEPSTFMMRNGGTDTNFLTSMHEVSNTLQYVPVEDQIPNALLNQNSCMQQRVLDFQEHAPSDFQYLHGIQQNPDIPCQPRSSYVPCSPGQVHVKISSETVAVMSVSHATEVQMVSDPTFAVNSALANMIADMQQRKHGLLDKPNKPIILSPEISASLSPIVSIGMESATDGLQLSEAEGNTPVNIDKNDVHGHEVVSVDNSTFLPESIAFEKKAVLKDTDGISKARLSSGVDVSPTPGKKETSHKCGPEYAHADVQVGSAEKDQKEKFGKTELMITEAEGPTMQFENSAEIQADAEGNSEHEKLAKIEPTTAEAEALAKGLQTIRNDDLEDIKELGSGTFGSVYHGKWRGSDVAIKRIKASCFSGRPAERERLIADFWKEALMLSCLHHPNVVSFYGVVRDGPECSLATVTEFMINGSLKKFLQKKDRTIDRRKRLIIAMDVAFGMVYLHAKDIVHFDLKCENLLVNMRDPHRPICKIGDLGLSKVKQHTLVSGGLRGTLPWMAPELLSGKSNKVSEKIDVYSFGIVMWELLTGEDPYADMQCASIIGGIVNNTIRPKIPTWCDPEWKSLMESCWSLDPTSRPSFSEISHKLQKMAAAINLK